MLPLLVNNLLISGVCLCSKRLILMHCLSSFQIISGNRFAALPPSADGFTYDFMVEMPSLPPSADGFTYDFMVEMIWGI